MSQLLADDLERSGELAAVRPSARRPRRRPPLINALAHLATALAAVLGSSIVIFLAIHLLPGDIAAIKAGTEASGADIEAMREALGLNRPLAVQYWDWFSHALRLDFGVSSLSHREVGSELLAKLAVTGPIALLSLLLALLIAIPLGTLAAARRRDWLGHLILGLTQFGVAIPGFVVGITLANLIAVRMHLLPATGFPTSGWARPDKALRSLILPVITLALPQAAVFVRFIRSATIDVLHRDHLRTARAQGLGVLQGLAESWRMVALPLSAVVALDFAGLITGAVIVEQVFALPGVGGFLLSSVSVRDYTVVQSVLFLMSASIIVFMALATLVQDLLDPRLRS